jgi:tetratricopeptide (TPR) repeat protein
MISRIARIFAAIFLALLLILPPPLAFACGPDFTAPTYTDFSAPDARDASYVRGKLGLLQRGYYHVYLFEAYRNLSGKPFNAPELASLGFQPTSASQQNASPSHSPAEPENWIATWESTRATLLGEKPKNSPRTFDPVGVTRAGMQDERYVAYYNCLSGAFENAVHTLQSRAAQFGAQSAVIKEWIAAQDQVFENCSADISYPPKPNPAVLPAASHPEDPAVIRADRAYQIAAALFYAGDFDAAQKAFEGIAKDSNSPYQKIAPYLEARALIRIGTLEGKDSEYDEAALSQAESQLRTIIADKNSPDFHAAAERLLGFVRIRLHRQDRLHELEASLQSGAPAKSFNQDLTDYLWLLDHPVLTKTLTITPASEGKPAQKGVTVDESSRLAGADMTDWIFTFSHSCGECYDHSLQRWNETKSLPWLVAALSQADAKESALPALLAATSKIAPDSPAYLTLTFHRLRLLEQSGNADAARHNLDQLLAQQGNSMPISARNEFLALRMKLASNLAEFLLFAPRLSTDATGVAPIPAGKSDYDPGTPEYAVTRPHFDSDASVALTEKLPLRFLADAAKSSTLAPALRSDIAVAVWTRAILLKNDAIAREMTPVVTELVPELKDDLAEYAKTSDPEAGESAAVFAILRNPGFRPFISASPGRGWFYSTTDNHFNSIDNFGDNWWCNFLPTQKNQHPTGGFYLMFSTLRAPLQEIYPGGAVSAPAFLSAQDKNAAAEEVNALAGLPAAPRWLGQFTIDWAKAHPDDPSVPEALHNVVRSWRYGCTEIDQTDAPNYSKDAFEILHSRYPDNDWTKKTPYWFK